jgi:hypothetical protein
MKKFEWRMYFWYGWKFVFNEDPSVAIIDANIDSHSNQQTCGIALNIRPDWSIYGDNPSVLRSLDPNTCESN